MIEKIRNISIRRWIGMVIGNVGLAIGVCIFRIVSMGNDPFSGMVIAISELLAIKYSIVLISLNCFLFVIQILLGKKMIGPGTFVNWFLIGYIVDFLYPLFEKAGKPETFLIRVLLLALGVAVTSLSCSFYQMAKLGVAPYDSISLIADQKTKIPYFWCRMITDVICAAVCLCSGGLLGLGTIICAFGLGPFISFFDQYISRPWIYPNHTGRNEKQKD